MTRPGHAMNTLLRSLRSATCLLALCLALPAWAQPAGVSMTVVPNELVQAAAGDWVLRGQSRFRVWGFEVYDASLWTTPGFNPAQAEGQRLALELRYLRDFAAKDIAERSIKEMRRHASLAVDQESRWLAEMLRVFPDVRKGDRLLGLQRPGEAAVFWFNGRPRGEIRDGEFARRFFGIWLSPQTSEPALRRALLGSAP
jgi:Chalcone isomerase-like